MPGVPMKYRKEDPMDNTTFVVRVVVIALALLALGVGGCCYWEPQYRVYEQRQTGMAELQRAESSRQIAIVEAEAKLQAAKSLAQAEIERAKGVAEANKIIGTSLQGNDAYLRYLWIQGIDGARAQVIYVPTEANLPILEAARLRAEAK
jgi:regulator of protease activity HflC (stomatin/prohibitin superfamily)